MKKMGYLFLVLFAKVFADDSYIGIEAGYRNDKIQWENKVSADTLSDKTKAHWNNLNILFIGGDFKLGCSYVYLRGEADWGKIFSGNSHLMRNFGSEALTNDETQTGKTRGHVIDTSLGIGIPIFFNCLQLNIAPVAGYAFQEQYLLDKDISGTAFGFINDAPQTTFISGFRKQRFRWYGPWIGLDASYEVNCNWKFLVGYEYHFVRYKAKTDEHITCDLLTINQNSKHAHGASATIGILYAYADDCCTCWNNFTVGLQGNFQYFFAKCAKSHVAGTALPNNLGTSRNVKWISMGFTLDLAYVF